MASRARQLSKLLSSDLLTVDVNNNRIGVNSTAPVTTLDVVGQGAPAPGKIRISDTDTALSDGELSSAIEFAQNDVSDPNSVNASIRAIGDGSIGNLALAFHTGQDIEKVRITSAGDVGIGTDDPSQKLSIGSTSGYLNSHGIGVYNPHSLGLRNGVLVYNDRGYNNTASYKAAAFKAVGVSGNALGISTDANTNGLGGTLNAHIKFDGSAYFGGNVSLADGTGIDFSANSNLAGMTGEVLDHYETGTYVPTWTNVVSDPTTYRNGIDNGTTSNGLSYVRIGNQVTVTGAAFWNGTSINNTRPNMSLPFQARVYSVSGTISNYSLGVASEIHYLNYQSTTAINLFVMNSGGAHANFGDNSTGEMYFNITYMTY